MSDPNASEPSDSASQGQTPPPYTPPAGQATPPYTPPAGQGPPQFGTPPSAPPYSAPPAGGQAPPPGYAPAPAAAPGAPLNQSDDKLWASLAHFGGVLSFIPPLIIWLIFKDRGPLVNQEGKESLNYQITIAIAWVASAILGVILGFIPYIGPLIALLITIVIWAAQIIFPIIGGVKVNGGGTYRYPFALRLVK